MQQPTDDPIVKSIHYQRRWFYVLWSAMLVVSICLWLLWITPARTGQATLTLMLHIHGIPDGTQVQTWIGPKNRWPKPSKRPDEVNCIQIPKGILQFSIGPIKVPIAYRRWTHSYMPNSTMT